MQRANVLSFEITEMYKSAAIVVPPHRTSGSSKKAPPEGTCRATDRRLAPNIGNIPLLPSLAPRRRARIARTPGWLGSKLSRYALLLYGTERAA